MKRIKETEEMNLGLAIMIVRRILGISKVKLAAKVGMSQTMLVRLEDNQRELTMNTFCSIAKAMEIPANQLLLFSCAPSAMSKEDYTRFQMAVDALFERVHKPTTN